MEFGYNNYLRLIPAETKQFVENVMEELYYYEDSSKSGSSLYYFNIMCACYVGIGKDQNYMSFTRKYDCIHYIDSSPIEVGHINDPQIDRLFKQYRKFFLADSPSECKHLMPSNIFFNMLQIVNKEATSYEKNKFLIKEIGYNMASEVALQAAEWLIELDKQRIEKEIADQLFEKYDYELISYFECASKIRKQLSKKIANGDIEAADYLQNRDDYLVPISLFIAIFEYDGEKTNDLEKYLNAKGINIWKIREILGLATDKSLAVGKSNLRVIEERYSSYLAKNILEVAKKIVDHTYTKNTCVEKLISLFDLSLIDLNLEEFTFFSDDEVDKICNKLKLSTMIYMSDTAKIKKVLSDQLENNEYLISPADINSLSLLISSYYHNGMISEYFKDNGIVLEEVLDIFDINVAKENLKDIKVTKKQILSNFVTIVTDNDKLLKLTPDKLEEKFSRVSKSHLLQDIFENFTNQELDAKFLYEIASYHENKELKEYLSKYLPETRELLRKIVSSYKTNLCNYADEQLLKEYSIISCIDNTDKLSYYLILSVGEYASDAVNVLKNLLKVKTNDNQRKTFSISEIGVKLKDIVHEEDTPIDIVINILTNPNMSFELQKNILKGQKILTKEEYGKRLEFDEKIDSVKCLHGTVAWGAAYYNYIRGDNEIDRKYLSILLGMLRYNGFKSKHDNLPFDMVKEKILSSRQISYGTETPFAVYHDFELFQGKVTRGKFINGLFNSNAVKNVYNYFSVSPDKVKYELLTNKNYDEKFSILDKKEVLDNMELPNVNPFSNESLLSYSNALNFHSQSIEEPYSKLINSNTIPEATTLIHNTIDSLYVEETIPVEQSSITKILFGEKKKKKVKLNPEALEKLKKELEEQSNYLKSEITSYNNLFEYMKSFYQKNKLRINKMDEKIEELKSMEEEIGKDDTVDLIRYQSTLKVLDSYKSSFTTTDALFRTEIFNVCNAIVSHFMVLNSIRTTRETLLPIIESEGIINKGIESERKVIGVVHEMSSLFTNLVVNNTDGINENITNLDNLDASLENYKALATGINKFLEDASKEVASKKDNVKVYGKKEN